LAPSFGGELPSPRELLSRHAKERRFIMADMDDMKHKGEELLGKGKESLGNATGDDSMRAEGQTDQGKANLKQAGDKIKDIFDGDKK
jgi:uncharacterized protein YjbJ (UPF0337 family)